MGKKNDAMDVRAKFGGKVAPARVALRSFFQVYVLHVLRTVWGQDVPEECCARTAKQHSEEQTERPRSISKAESPILFQRFCRLMLLRRLSLIVGAPHGS